MILFIDDEERYVNSYVEDLRFSGYDVIWETETDAALKFFEANYKQLDLLILDIMMPPGTSFDHEETQMGLRTGVFFYERIRQKAPDLPIIILTNVGDPSTDNLSNIYSLIMNDKNCSFHRKITLLPHQLTEEVKRVVEESKAMRGLK